MKSNFSFTNQTTLTAALASLLVAGSAFAHSGKSHEAPNHATAAHTAHAAHAGHASSSHGAAGVHEQGHGHGPAASEETEFGRPGDAAHADRTVRIGMTDDMRFTPSTLQAKVGETVRFVIANEGQVLHEMVLGTEDELSAHHTAMREQAMDEHGGPSMAHVDPGHEGEIVWTFTRAGTFNFACLLPGHFEAGMVGQVVVQ